MNWLHVPEEVWQAIIANLSLAEQQPLALTSQAFRVLVARNRAMRVEAQLRRLLQEMEESHRGIERLLADEEEARRRLESAPPGGRRRDALITLNATRGWRQSGAKAPFPYLDFGNQPFTVFRADTRPPSEIFITGFARLTHEVPQLGMSLDVGGIAHHLVSTSKSATDAAEFAVIRGRDPRTMAEVRSGVRSNRSSLTRVWLYLCLATRGFYLLAPGEARRNRHEVALIGIPTTHVLAAVEFDVERITATGRWHANPHSALPRELVDTLHRLVAEIIRRLTSPHLNV